MTRDVISLPIEDLSAFTHALKRELAKSEGEIGHLALMNTVARAAGFRNIQHLRAIQMATSRLEQPEPLGADAALVEAVLRQFDAKARLVRWPAKTIHQHLAVRAIWARLPRHISMTERQISNYLNEWHLFGDAAILRRTMVELGLITRSADCRDYRRTEAPPTAEAKLIIRKLEQRLNVSPVIARV